MQKKMVACSIRRDIGRVKVDCSLHISYFKKAKSTQNTRGLPRHLPRVGKTRLSTSLSSLRGFAEQTTGKGTPVGTHLARYQRGSSSRLAKSTDFVSSKGNHCNGGISFL